ncbi:MAG: alpha/beta fold hydrolase [Bacteroidota bacterium]
MNLKSEIIPVRFADGSSNSINIFRSHTASAQTVIVIFPAMGVKANYYRHYASEVSKQDVHVVTIDHRGYGHSSVKPSGKENFGYKEQVEMEYPEIINKVKELFPSQKLVVMGHSLGGQMGSMFVSRYHHLVNGLILNASCSVYYNGWGKASYGILAFAKFSDLLAKALGYYPGNKIGFGGVEAQGVIKDWYHTAKTGKFSASGSTYNYNESMKNCKVPVLGITYQGDSSAPPAALINLLHKFSSAKVEYHHVPHPDFPKKKYNHYSWVKEPLISLSLITNWLKKIE